MYLYVYTHMYVTPWIPYVYVPNEENRTTGTFASAITIIFILEYSYV